MKYTDYQLSEEYRDRFALNNGEMYLIKEALFAYAEQARQEVLALEKEGKQSIIGSEFYQHLANDVLLKLDAWIEKPARDTFDDEE